MWFITQFLLFYCLQMNFADTLSGLTIALDWLKLGVYNITLPYQLYARGNGVIGSYNQSNSCYKITLTF